MSNEQIKPAAWQFYQDGEWRTGTETNNHRHNTEEGGFPVRDLYAIPDGYVLVPVEPTAEMMDEPFCEVVRHNGINPGAVYKVMVKAYQDAMHKGEEL